MGNVVVVGAGMTGRAVTLILARCAQAVVLDERDATPAPAAAAAVRPVAPAACCAGR